MKHYYTAFLCGNASFVTPFTSKENLSNTTAAPSYLLDLHPAAAPGASIPLQASSSFFPIRARKNLSDAIHIKSFGNSRRVTPGIYSTTPIIPFNSNTGVSGMYHLHYLEDGNSHRHK